MNFSVGIVEFGVFLLYLVIAGFLIRAIETKWPDSAAGQALAFIF